MRILSGIAAAFLILATPANAQEASNNETPNSKVWTIDDAVTAAISQAIQPGFDAYFQTSAETVQVMADLCVAPSNEALKAARDQFAHLVDAWSRIEFVRLGPLSRDNNLERTLFWPDRRGRGLKQVQAAIATADEAVIDPVTLGSQSVAVQGLLALEYALFGTGSEELAGETEHRCAYARAIAENLTAIAFDLQTGWKGDGDIADLWQNPGPDNPLFRDEREQLRALLKLVSDGAEIMIAQRLTPFMGEQLDEYSAKSALYWRSGQTLNSLRGNAEGLRAIAKAARLEDLIEGDDKRVVASLEFEFTNIERILGMIEIPPADEPMDDKNYGSLGYFRVVLESVYTISGSTIPGLFGLTSGFSSLDGD